MLNIRTEYYVKLKKEGKNMSKLVNDFLHALHEYTICPLCYDLDVEVPRCKNCNGRALICQNPSCKAHLRAQMRDCIVDPETGVMCTPETFKGDKA